MKALYCFSADPITYGHIDIINRAAKVFDEIIVGIGLNPSKKDFLFSLDERLDMARHSLSHIKNVQVVSFDGMLVDFAYEQNIPVVVKGVRDVKDFEYETVLHQVGESQKLGIDTFLIPANRELAHVSSSIAKAVQKEHGFVHEYVPLFVKQRLEARMSGQYIVGITGDIGVGKSYITKRLQEVCSQKGIPAHAIELDDVVHDILEGRPEQRYCDLRKEIITLFGESVALPNGAINRVVLGELVFGDKEKMDQLNRVVYTPLLVRLRKELYGKKGVVFLTSALLPESKSLYLCNNNIILVTADAQTQEQRLQSRNLTSDQITRRLSSQYRADEKKKIIDGAIAKDRHGTVWVVDNSVGASVTVDALLDDIVRKLEVKKDS